MSRGGGAQEHEEATVSKARGAVPDPMSITPAPRTLPGALTDTWKHDLVPPRALPLILRAVPYAKGLFLLFPL